MRCEALGLSEKQRSLFSCKPSGKEQSVLALAIILAMAGPYMLRGDITQQHTQILYPSLDRDARESFRGGGGCPPPCFQHRKSFFIVYFESRKITKHIKCVTKGPQMCRMGRDTTRQADE